MPNQKAVARAIIPGGKIYAKVTAAIMEKIIPSLAQKRVGAPGSNLFIPRFSTKSRAKAVPCTWIREDRVERAAESSVSIKK